MIENLCVCVCVCVCEKENPNTVFIFSVKHTREQTVLANLFLAAGKSIQSYWVVTRQKSGVLFGDVVCGK